MTSPVPIRRALLSVSDKTDLVPFASALAARGVALISTGGTAKVLTQAGLPVASVESVTGFPEGLDGRVKTLHPGIHGGLLAQRDNAEHQAFLKKHGIEPIDLLCINLYPFQKAVADPNAPLSHAIENIDIGGPAMLRAASKNFQWVTVVSSPSRYDHVIAELDANGGATTYDLRAELAAAAFAHTAEYDAAIATYLSRRTTPAFPRVLNLRYTKVDELRYGENPHQSAALYRDAASTGPTVVNATQLHGKQLSYNNILDAAAALEAVKGLSKLVSPEGRFGNGASGSAGAVVVKHTNPCGGAVASDLASAVKMAIAGDPVAAYGGILAVDRPVDRAAAEIIADKANFFEVVVAPSYAEDALGVLRERWANVRLLAVGDREPSVARKLDYRSVPGGMLVQDRDCRAPDPSLWEHKAGPKPTPDQLRSAGVLSVLCRAVSSNAIVIGGPDPAFAGGGGGGRLFGVGSGQVDRVSACRLAVSKAGALAKGAIAVGDAFFPFPDGPQVLAEAGVKMIVHPGGSKRDQETFDLCEKHGICCMVTNMRHFRH